jgi:RimJ/RimL family protein N-acetyltransferase
VADEPQLRSPRLLLRRWRAGDLEPFAQMNADPEVMEFYPPPPADAPSVVERSASHVERIEAGFVDRGFGLWAVEVPGEAGFIGFIGLQPVDAQLAFAPAVEVGWRLARPFWGRGLATEGAMAAMRFAFEELELPSLVALTAAVNTRSRGVIERLRMRRDPGEDFLYPRIASGDRLCEHVLYRADAAHWLISSRHVRALHQHDRP